MSDDMNIILGSSNVFRDLGHLDAAREQPRSLGPFRSRLPLESVLKEDFHRKIPRIRSIGLAHAQTKVCGTRLI